MTDMSKPGIYAVHDVRQRFAVNTLAASSEKRNVMMWRLSVCLSRLHTHRDSPGGSMRCDQRTYRPANNEDVDSRNDAKANYRIVIEMVHYCAPQTEQLYKSQVAGVKSLKYQ